MMSSALRHRIMLTAYHNWKINLSDILKYEI